MVSSEFSHVHIHSSEQGWSWGSGAALPAAPLTQPLLLLHLPPGFPGRSSPGDALAQRSQEQSCIPVQNLCERLELLSPTTKQEMLPAVQELTCLKVFFLSKAFMTLGGGINLILGKLRLVLYGQNTCHVFTTDLSGTERMNQASDCWQTTLAKVAERLIFKVTSLY